MFCNKCGTWVEKGQQFCSKCGNRIYWLEGSQSATPTQTIEVAQTNAVPPPAICQPSNLASTGQPILAAQVVMPEKNKRTALIILVALGCISMFIIISFIVTAGAVYIVSGGGGGNIQGGDPTQPDVDNGVTSVIYDRVYNKYIGSASDANKMVIYDSTENKKTCKNSKIAEIENRLINNYKITAVNLCELDIGFARELEKVVGYVYDKYPKARGYLTNLTLYYTEGDSGQAIAVHQIGGSFVTNDGSLPFVLKRLIGLNAAYYLNPKKMEYSIASSVAAGHFPKNTTIYSPLAHEFGHYLSVLAASVDKPSTNLTYVKNSEDYNNADLVFQDWGNTQTTSRAIIDRAYSNYKLKYNHNIDLLGFRSSISKYAVAKRDGTNEYIYDETIAEAFHDVYNNGPNAARASIEIVEVLGEYIRRLK